jgi:hypothetical protein
MPGEQFPHLFLPNIAQALSYTAPASGFSRTRLPHRARQEHGAKLRAELNAVWREAEQDKRGRKAISLPVRDGTYLEFTSQAGFDLITKSLEDLRQNIRLLNISKEITDDGVLTKATIYVPSGK